MSLLTGNMKIPGGWGKEGDANQSEVGDNAGIVSEKGDVVDDAGKTIARITEGKPLDLVGNIVTSTGDIVGKDGTILGKATPLYGLTEAVSGDKDKGNSARNRDSGIDLLDGAKPVVDNVGKTLNLKDQSTDAGTEDTGTEKLASETDKTSDEPANSTAQNEPEAKKPVDVDERKLDDKAPETDNAETVKPVEAGDTKSEVATTKEQDAPPKESDKLDQISNPDDFVVKDDETKDGDKLDDEPAKDTTTKAPASDVQSEIPEDAKTTTTGEDDGPVPEFEKYPGARVNEEGKIIFDDQSIGVVADGDVEKLAGKEVDAEGNIINDTGTVVGKAELKDELKEVDASVLKGTKVNKLGNLVNDKGQVVGRVTEGILKNLVGRKADEKGEIWNDNGKVIGKAEPIPETELEEFKDPSPFEDFPDATVESDGSVKFNGEVIGKVVDGDPKKLKGKKVDADGDILDRNGNVIGKAERWEAEEAPPEPEADRSILAGKRVNKAGNVVDSHGTIFGRLVEGDSKRLNGRMCDKKGNVLSESGDIIGRAEVVPEGEREGLKEGPFAELPGCTVNKEGKVVTPGGDVVGRLTSGDPKVLFGRAVDEDGDILDKNGNSIGKAERWDEPVVEKTKGPMAGRKVNREGNVVDADGNLIGKLTTGDLSICAGKEIDDDGDVVDSKGNTIGHVSLLGDIPEPEPEPEAPTESPEDKAKREEAEKDEKLAKQMGACIENCLERIRPICKLITDRIEKAERQPKEELDEEQLVKDVRPLIEEGNKILTESTGIIKGLDPDGRIQRNAKSKTHTREATPAEYHLADVLKELTGTVTQCIDNAKKKIEGMPHAKKELNPLWGLMTEPLFQILAAVGLLLNGVLELVGRLLSGLGLGGIVNNLLGGLGLTNVLKSLGVGGVVTALTGGDKKKK